MWRKFTFFDEKNTVDEGRLSQAVKDTSITCCSSGRGLAFVGDSLGWIHTINKQLEILSFPAHNNAVTLLQSCDQRSLLVSVADGKISEVKVWLPEKTDEQGIPLCVRIIKPDPRALIKGGFQANAAISVPKVTAVAIHPNMSLLVLGFSDGNIMFYRGDVTREKGSKVKVIPILTNRITSFHIQHKQVTYLFVTTLSNVYCLNCTTRDKETSVMLDDVGCKEGCTTLTDGKHDHLMIMARNDAMYTYTNESRAACFAFDGEKIMASWHRGYLIVASKLMGTIVPGEEIMITAYDLSNKLIALSLIVRGLKGMFSEWGGLYLISADSSLTLLSEKDLQSKFEILFRKNQFDIAINLSKTQSCALEEVAEILKQYGDWLYNKGNFNSAIDQYIKAIPHLEPSYVIKKYLDTQHIYHLTRYLEEIHASGSTTADYTILLLNCYTRLRDTEKLDDFIKGKNGAVDCDVELGVRMCRNSGYFDHALAIAKKHELHNDYLSILINDKKDYSLAIKYVKELDLKLSKESILNYGFQFLNHVPKATTEILVKLCSTKCEFSENQLYSHEAGIDAYYAEPEEFEYLLVGHSEQAIELLEKMAEIPGRLSGHMYSMLLSEYFSHYSVAPEGQEKNILSEKLLKMLKDKDYKYDKDDALLLCDKHRFQNGKLLLLEMAGRYEDLLHWYAQHKNMNEIIKICKSYSHCQPKLWCLALKVLTAEASIEPPSNDHLSVILESIGTEKDNLLPPLEIVDLLSSSPHITLGQVREYLLKVVDSYTASIKEEEEKTKQYMDETEKMKEKIKKIRTSAVEFTETKCHACNRELSLPSVHFLCEHSFHQHCFETHSENDSECPICLPEHKNMIERIRLQELSRCQHDQFQEQLERAEDPFDVISDYLGKGLFTHLHSLATMYPSLNTTKNQGDIFASHFSHSFSVAEERSIDSMPGTVVPHTEAHLRVLGRSDGHTQITGNEARLRLEERRNQGVIEVEPIGRKLTSFSSKKIPEEITEGRLRSKMPPPVPTAVEPENWHARRNTVLSTLSEGRLRAELPSNIVNVAHEGKLRTTDRYFPQKEGIGRQNPSDMEIDSISASLSNTKISIKNPLEVNPFEIMDQNTAPFEEYETEELNNPFEEGYDDSKNPFAEEDKDTKDRHNTFKEDYDPNLNPFGEC